MKNIRSSHRMRIFGSYGLLYAVSAARASQQDAASIRAEGGLVTVRLLASSMFYKLWHERNSLASGE